MADRRLVAQSITRSGQVRQLVTRCGFAGSTFFSWAITHIDDDSRLDGSPGQLQGMIFGRYPEVSEHDVAEMLAVMNDIDLAVWYEVVDSPGERYLYFPRFTTHQTLREDRYGPSRLPAPPNWRPEEGHPYSKNDERKAKWKPGQPTVTELRREKPQRDLRKTARVPKRPATQDRSLWEAPAASTTHPPRDHSATTAQPERDHAAPTSATTSQPLGAPTGTEDASRLASPPLASPRLASQDTSHLATAQPADAVQGTDELRSGTSATPPEGETKIEQLQRLENEVQDEGLKTSLRRKRERLQAGQRSGMSMTTPIWDDGCVCGHSRLVHGGTAHDGRCWAMSCAVEIVAGRASASRCERYVLEATA